MGWIDKLDQTKVYIGYQDEKLYDNLEAIFAAMLF